MIRVLIRFRALNTKIGNIGNAKLEGLTTQLHLEGNRYNIALVRISYMLHRSMFWLTIATAIRPCILSCACLSLCFYPSLTLPSHIAFLSAQPSIHFSSLESLRYFIHIYTFSLVLKKLRPSRYLKHHVLIFG